MPSIYKEVEIDVDLDDFTDDELLEEVERRNIGLTDFELYDSKEFVNKMYEKFRQGKNIDEELRKFFWQSIGRIA